MTGSQLTAWIQGDLEDVLPTTDRPLTEDDLDTVTTTILETLDQGRNVIAREDAAARRTP